jgi:polynucleotide 5'-hydroxyl-kinase GRC3/NOL9
MADLDIPHSWHQSAEAILKNRWRKILVIGGVDTGKSTYCGYLSNRLLDGDGQVAVIDADVGQKDIGPPACITAGYPARSSRLSETRPEGFYFVGAVTPARHLLPMVAGTRALMETESAGFLIINTTGMIRGIGRVLKGFKIEALRPDVIVGLERSHELSAILRAHRNHPIIRLSPSQMAAPKSPHERAYAREASFQRYFEAGQDVTLDREGMIFQRTLLFNGKRLERKPFLHCEITSEGILAVSEGPLERDGITALPHGFEENLLCGLADGNADCMGLALIRRIDVKNMAITLFTPVSPERIRIIQFGDIYLQADGRSLDQRRPRDL